MPKAGEKGRTRNNHKIVPSAITPKIDEPHGPSKLFPIVAIGASAGGLEALTQFVGHISPEIGMAYVVVQHLDPKHKSMLVELLARHATISVEEVRHRTKVQKDRMYVIPPNKNMYLERGSLCLCSRETSPAKEMPIDFLFRTVAVDRPGNCIGVVLSGTGSDGSLGIQEIKSAGGITFAQDQNSAKQDGMPRAAISTGHVDFVMPPDGIVRELKRIARHPYTNGKRIDGLGEETLLGQIFTILRKRTGVDFKHYKQSTVKRRIVRRMALLKVEGIDRYIELLESNPQELDALYQDMLIKVTCFFREPASFQVLKEHVFPVIMRNRGPKEPIRLWVPGCSSGEEVYSLAIALLEFLGDNEGAAPVQIFGTDISDTALAKARSGIYIENIALDVSAERLRRWFVKVDRGYQISKDIREMCIFAKQNLTSDPPFSKIDLISCRNLLIYLDSVFQTRVMPIFHYAMKPSGFLMLGNAESVGTHHDLFDPVDKKAKIYTKKLSGTLPGVVFGRQEELLPEQRQAGQVERHAMPDVQKAADLFIVSRFAPMGVLVDEELKIIQFRGATGDYLEPAAGRASFQLLKMARGNLSLELRGLIQEARAAGRSIRREHVRFQPKEGSVRDINLEVAPIRGEASAGYHFLVLFEEATASPSAGEPAPAVAPEKTEPNLEVADLRRELAANKSYLQATVEEAEAANEELKSANEEIMSSNEELQSTNEELETAKEELQSANEELTTVNEEVQTRNTELSRLNGDLNNFLGSVNVPVIMLGTDLRIRRFTPKTHRVFNLIPTDIGRPFGDIKQKVNVPHFERLISQVIDTTIIHEQEVTDDEGMYYHLSIRPYWTPEKKIDGAVLVFQDIDSIKRSSLLLDELKTYAESIVEAVFDPLLVLSADFVIQRANAAYYRLFQTDAKQTENRSLFALDKSQWDVPELRQLLKRTFKRRRKSEPVEMTEHFPRVGELSLLINARPILRKSGEPPLILLTMADVTARKKAEAEKAQLDAQLGKERALFEAILRQIGVGAGIFEAPAGKLVLANHRFEEIFRQKLPALTNISSFRKVRAVHVTPGVHQGFDWPMERSLRKGETVPLEEMALERSGERMVLQVSSTPVYDPAKKMIAVVALFQDVTESKRNKEEIVEISSREQRRIAHDLHDGLGQELAAIGYRVKALKSRLTRSQPEEAEEAGEIGALAAAALSRTRDLVKFIQPVAMDSRGLMQGLKDLADSSSRLYRVNCTFRCPKSVPINNPNVAINVFRIAQEAVHNAAKHGKSRKINIGLGRTGNLAKLTIFNDGIDFNPSRSARKRGLGIHIMSYRASALQGELTITRQRPKGTLVTCIFKANPTL
jgi:two-component system CheB/CheR fusion protein